MKRTFKTPTTVHLAITDVCNANCPHCLNYWRDDKSRKIQLDYNSMKMIVEKLSEANIFHVVLSGGEPFANFDVLEYGFKLLKDKNISVSCNSNLMLATPDKLERLKDVGVDHILTSLMSYRPELVNKGFNMPDAFDRVVSGIKLAVESKIRVSVNMVVSNYNKDDVYETARFVHSLGCQKIFGTRNVPVADKFGKVPLDQQYTQEEALEVLDQLVKAKNDFGIMIGSLISYPLCLLADLEKYRDFVGRGCPSTSGHRININANGEVNVCTHEERSYGNIFEDKIENIYARMTNWHSGEYYNSECEGCEYISVCRTGCRTAASAYYKRYNAKDPLTVGKYNFSKPYNFILDDTTADKIKNGATFTVPKRIRYRDEGSFYVLNARWANSMSCSKKTGEFIKKRHEDGKPFNIKDFGEENLDTFITLFYKDIIESDDLQLDDLRHMDGLTIDNIDLSYTV